MFALRFVKNNRPSVFLIVALSLVGALSFITIAGRVDLVTYARAPSNLGSNAEGVTASAALDWQIETISTAYIYDTIQFGASLALDKNDHPRISYYDPGSGDLIYTYRGASTWQKTTVDSGGNVGMHTSLALDSNDYPHISYYDVSNLHLKYAHYNGSSWVSDTVDSAVYAGESTSIALDPANNPRISYYRGGSCGTSGDLYCNLRYADYNGSWNPLRVHYSTAKLGQFTSLDLDSTDHPHISYYHADNGDLRYLYQTTAGWQWDLGIVDSSGNVGADTSLALDTNDRPHISYWNVGDSDLMYAYYNGSIWITKTVDSAGSVGRSTSLALDSAGQPHISYYDLSNDTLKYAYYDGSQWQIDVVAGTGNVHGYEGTSLELDSMDLPHISYYTTSGVRYAYVERSRVYLPGVFWNYGPNRYAVIVGIADYPGTEDDLDYTDDDAEDFRQMLLDRGDFEADNINMLIDSQATESNIEDAITNWLDSREGANDLVVFFFSGHGTRATDCSGDESDGYDECLFAYGGYILDDALDDWLDNLESNRVVVLVDACFSGGLIGAALEGGALEDVRCKCLPPPDGTRGSSMAGDGFAKDVDQSGRLVITASREDETSVESSSWEHGLFTYYLLQALETPSADTHDGNGWISGEESYDYLYPRVVAAFFSEQHPQESDGISGEVDLTQP